MSARWWLAAATALAATSAIADDVPPPERYHEGNEVILRAPPRPPQKPPEPKKPPKPTDPGPADDPARLLAVEAWDLTVTETIVGTSTKTLAEQVTCKGSAGMRVVGTAVLKSAFSLGNVARSWEGDFEGNVTAEEG